MKKILAIICALFVLAACSDQQTLVSDGSTAVIDGDGIVYTKQDLFEDLKKNDFSSIIRADLTERLANFEEIDLETINGKVEDYFTELKAQYADSYETMMSYYGGEESFRETITSSYLLDALIKKYCDYNFDSLVQEYSPVLAKVQSFSDEDKAKTMIENINNGMSFEEACEEAGVSTVPTETVYTTASDIDSQLKDWFYDCEVGLSASPVVVLTDTTGSDGAVTTTKSYYVIEVLEKDANEFKDEFYSSIGSELDTTSVFNYYFNKYNVEVYDQSVYEVLSETYEGIK